MAYSEAQKKYAKEWYYKNRERLLADPVRRAAKKKRQNQAYENNRMIFLIYSQILRLANPENYKEQKARQYIKHRDEMLEKRKKQRRTEEYKEYVRNYRQKNKDKINAQQRVTSKRSIEKAIMKLSDSYIVGQILCSSYNTLSRKELYANKDLIEQKRIEILISRIKKQITDHGKENS
jgi:hypothetical protein